MEAFAVLVARAGIVLISLGSIVYGQPGCPAVNFLLPPAIQIHQRFIGGALERKSDYTYTRSRFNTSPPYAKVETAPNVAAAPVTCSGYPGRPLQPPPGWHPGMDNQLGTASAVPVLADLTADGRWSAVAFSFSSSNTAISVARFTASSTLQDVTNYTVGRSPFSALAADFNNDGKKDLVVFNEGAFNGPNGGLSILINNGDGTFKPAVNYPAGVSPGAGTVQDFNGDGKLDIA